MLSYWEKVFYEYEVIVVGAGITGLSVASSILERKPGISIAVFDSRSIPAAASTRNAGFACFGSPTEVLSDIENMGEDATLKLVERRWKGLAKLRNRLSDSQIDYEKKGGYEIIVENQLDCLDRLDYLNKLLSEIVGPKVYSSSNAQISEFGFNSNWCRALVYNPYEGQLHSGKMIKNLRRYASGLGAEILGGIHVSSFTEEADFVHLRSSEGNIFKARKVIFCNNAYSALLFPDEDIKPGRGLVMLSNKTRIPFEGAFHFDEGFYYFRDIDGRLLIGGGRNEDFENENTYEEGVNEKIKRAILEKVKMILPGKDNKEEMWWSGIMAFGKNKETLIRKKGDHVHMAVRLSGMGVALASQLGEELAGTVIDELS